MAELTAALLKYGEPLKTKVGGLLLTATTVETPSGAEYAEKGVELNLGKLGLTDEAIFGAQEAAGPTGGTGEVAATTSFPAAIWSTPLVTASTASKGERVIVGYATAVTITTGKAFLRIFAQNVAGEKEPLLEPKTSVKAPVSLCSCTVFTLGK